MSEITGDRCIRILYLSVLIILLIVTFSFAQQAPFLLNTEFQSADEVAKQINFLTGDTLLKAGNQEFQTVAGKTPYSYVSNNVEYWAQKVCNPAESCSVNDVMLTDPFSVLPENPNAETSLKQLDRTLLTHGASIYDAATWQIAVALASRQGLIDTPGAEELILNQLNRLRKTSTKAPSPCDTCPGDGFTYGEEKATIPNFQYAYNLRLLGPSFFVADPFKGTIYESLVSTPGAIITEGYDKNITWPDYKPITGENAWANLLAPAQASWLLYGSAKDIPFKSDLIQHALEYLWALQNQQSKLGSFFYALNGSTANDGSNLPTGTISNENNFSTLGGLKLLQIILLRIAHLSDEWSTLSSFDKAQLNTAVNVIDIMLYGGEMPLGSTKGLLYFLKNYSKNPEANAFFQGGTVVGDIFSSSEGSGATSYAVDVNTWGVVNLGPETVDNWYGEGTAYRMWIDTRTRGGYFKNGELWGVGYSDNQVTEGEHDGDSIVMSGEWTSGALNMIQMLIRYYSQNPPSNTINVDMNRLQQDQTSILANLLKLRTDHYVTDHDEFISGVGPDYQSSVGNDELAYLYASERYYIPFGWYANPIASTASSTWALYNSFSFNPFGIYGTLDSPKFNLDDTPDYNPAKWKLGYDSGDVTVFEIFGDSVEFTVSYTNNQEEMIDIIGADNPVQTDGYTRIPVPTEATKLNFAYRNPNNEAGDPNFYGACNVILTDEVRNQLKRIPTHTAIMVVWSADGQMPCELMISENDYIYDPANDLEPRDASCDELGDCSIDDIPPTIPENVYTVEKSSRSVTIGWSASTDDESGLSHYNVYVDGVLAQVLVKGILTYTPTAVKVTIPGLEPETMYSITVSATDFAGNESEQSFPSHKETTEDENDIIPPSVPENIHTVNKTTNSITIGWNDSVDDMSGIAYYSVFIDGLLTEVLDKGILTVQPMSTEVIISDLVSGVEYSIEICATDNAGNKSAKSSPPHLEITEIEVICDPNLPYCLEEIDSDSVRVTVQPADWADIHYTLNGGGQLNFRMVASGTNHTYEINGLTKGDVISFFLTIGAPAYDTVWYSHTFKSGKFDEVTGIFN